MLGADVDDRMIVELDLVSRESISRAFAAVRERAGDPDVLVYNAGYLEGRDLPPDKELLEHVPVEIFETAQSGRSSEAAASLAQMAARGATGDPKLAAIVRERQYLVSEWQQRDVARSAAVSQAPDKRDKQAEATPGQVGARAFEQIGLTRRRDGCHPVD